MARRNNTSDGCGVLFIIALIWAAFHDYPIVSSLVLICILYYRFGYRWVPRGTHRRTIISSKLGSSRVTEIYDHRTNSKPCFKCGRTVSRAEDGTFKCCGRTWG